MSELYAALDIGTSKIATIIAKMPAGDTVEVLGVGRSPSRGMKKGIVTDVTQLSEAIRASVREAENMADCSIDSVFAGISGDHIRSVSSRGVSSNSGAEIDETTKLRAIESSKQFDFHGDYQLLHTIPRHYTLDGTSGIKQPVGMSGTRLEADVLLIACSVTALQNIKNCLRRCGIGADQFILEHIASSEAVLSEDEKNLGVCLVDVGGGTTDVAVFCDGSLVSAEVIPVAGDHVTSDITRGLRIPTGGAEALKLEHGTVMLAGDDSGNEELGVPSLGGRAERRVLRKELVDVIRPRYEELFHLVIAKLKESGYDINELVSGIVLTGGSCKIHGAADLAEDVFSAPVRVGVPTNIRGCSEMLSKPNFSTTVGLLRHGYKYKHEQHGIGGDWWRSWRKRLATAWRQV